MTADAKRAWQTLDVFARAYGKLTKNQLDDLVAFVVKAGGRHRVARGR